MRILIRLTAPNHALTINMAQSDEAAQDVILSP